MSRIARWFLTLAVALLAAGATMGSAAAAPRAADTSPPNTARLEHAYQAERWHLREMEHRLYEAHQYAERVAALITHLKAHGLDTAPLDRALDAFRAHMADARHQWEAARNTLATHAGFDAQGHVTDAAKAGATLRDAHSHLMRGRAILGAADRALHEAVAAFLRAHH
jgi:hypothetical protein